MMQKRRPRTALRFSDDERPPRPALVFILAFAALLFFRWREQPATSATSGAPTLYNDDMLGVSRLDTDKGIAQFETRVKEDPRDFLSLTILGQLYSRRGRDKSDLSDFGRAEQAFNHALQLNPEHAAAKVAGGRLRVTTQVLGGARCRARALSEEPRESRRARDDGRRASRNRPVPGRRRSDCKLTEKIGEMPAMLARRAQFAELKGQTGPAVTLLQRAVETMRRTADPAPEIAWFEARLGDVYYHTGCLAESERHFDAALSLYKHLSARAHRPRRHQGRAGEASACARSLRSRRRRVADAAPPVRSRHDRGASRERAAAAKRYAAGEEMVKMAGENQAAYYRELSVFYAERLGKAAEAARPRAEGSGAPEGRQAATTCWRGRSIGTSASTKRRPPSARR